MRNFDNSKVYFDNFRNTGAGGKHKGARNILISVRQ